MSTLKVDTILKRTGTGTITVGQSGDTVALPSVTLTTALPIAQGGTGGTSFSAAGLSNTPSFRVNYSGAPNNGQDAANNTYSIATLNGEVFDTDSAYDTSTYKFTVPSGKAGKYFFYYQYYFNETSVGSPRAYIYKNGSQLARFGTYDSGAVSGFNYVMNGVSVIDDASVGDYYSAYIYHNSGEAKQVYGGNEASYFMGYKLIG